MTLGAWSWATCCCSCCCCFASAWSCCCRLLMRNEPAARVVLITRRHTSAPHSMPTISSRNGIRRRAPPTSAVSGLAAPVAARGVVRGTGPVGGAVLGGAVLGGAVLGGAAWGAVLGGAAWGAVLGGAAVLALGGASVPSASTAFSPGRPGGVTVRAGGRAVCDRVPRAGEVPRDGPSRAAGQRAAGQRAAGQAAGAPHRAEPAHAGPAHAGPAARAGGCPGDPGRPGYAGAPSRLFGSPCHPPLHRRHAAFLDSFRGAQPHRCRTRISGELFG